MNYQERKRHMNRYNPQYQIAKAESALELLVVFAAFLTICGIAWVALAIF